MENFLQKTTFRRTSNVFGLPSISSSVRYTTVQISENTQDMEWDIIDVLQEETIQGDIYNKDEVILYNKIIEEEPTSVTSESTILEDSNSDFSL